MVSLRARLNKVRAGDQARHSDTTIDELPMVQYNRTRLIAQIDADFDAVDCGADPYSTAAVGIDKALTPIEETFSSTPPKRPSEISQDGTVDGSTGKSSLDAGVVVVIILLSLLLVVAAVFMVYRRQLSAPVERAVENPHYSTTAAGFQRGGKSATLPRSRVVPHLPAAASGDLNAGAAGVSNPLYAIPFETTEGDAQAQHGGAQVTYTNADQFVVADGNGVDRTDVFANDAYEYMEVGSEGANGHAVEYASYAGTSL